MVDARVRQSDHTVTATDAVWHTVHGPGNLECCKGQYAGSFNRRWVDGSWQSKFPDEPAEHHAACIARLVYYRYLNPAIMYVPFIVTEWHPTHASIGSTPETFDIVSSTVDIESRKNLAQISRMLTQITKGVEFTDDTPSHIPMNGFVREAISEITSWLLRGKFIVAYESCRVLNLAPLSCGCAGGRN